MRSLAGWWRGWAAQVSALALRTVGAALTAGLVVGLAAPAPAVAQPADAAGETAPAATDAPAWLEPRGVNVVDLVGVVPEDVLRDSMVVYQPGIALAFYESGTRSGNTVTVRVRFVSKSNTGAACLGMPGGFDTWPTVSPAGVLHIFQGNTDVTRQVASSFPLVAAGQIQPSANTGNQDRYPSTTVQAQFDSAGGLVLPANMGCKLYVNGASGALTGVFTFNAAQTVQAQVLGSQSMQFHSYIGPGYAGQLASLQQQLIAKYGNRAEDLKVNPPSGTEFVWVRYPATPVAPWDPSTPSGGTYRIRRSNAKLSVDHVVSMAIPLYGQWQDADQSSGSKFLPYFTDSVAVSAPEYFVPTGVAYNACMTNGGCPDSLLQQIHDATMPMTVYYLALSRVSADLEQVKLAAVGPSWSPGQQPSAQANAVAEGDAATAPAEVGPSAIDAPYNVHLPYIAAHRALAADNPAAGCPCGWFTGDGRMVDFVQKP